MNPKQGSADDAMRQQLLNRAKESYSRREGDSNNLKYFDPSKEFKLWRALPTKGGPHIIDIIPFRAGKNFPTTNHVNEGEWSYNLDLYVHGNVGPLKKSVVCPAKNYGNPCPICDEVEKLIHDGAEWQDIPIVPVRRCVYNVLVVDDDKTEAEGVQIWDVPHTYFEKIISGLAKSARDGGYIAFASPRKEIGRSIAFEVGSDKYRKITGHRFEARGYEIPQSILDQAKCLDSLIVVHSAEEIEKILYGDAEKPEGEVQTDSPRRLSSLRSQQQAIGGGDDSGDVQDYAPEPEQPEPLPTTAKPSLRSVIDECPQGGVFGEGFDSYAECDDCPDRQKKACAEKKDEILRAAKPTTPTRRTLSRPT